MLAAMLSELRTPVPTLPDVVRVLRASPRSRWSSSSSSPTSAPSIVLVAILGRDPRGRRHAGEHLVALASRSLRADRRWRSSSDVVEDYQIDRAHGVPRSGERRRGRPLQPRAGRDRGRARAACSGSGYLHGVADEPGLRARAAHRLHLHRRRGRSSGSSASAFVLALFALLLWRAIRIAFLSKDPFGTYLASGRRVDVRDPDVRERRHGDRHHADHRHPVAVPVTTAAGRCSRTSSAVGILLNVHMRRFPKARAQRRRVAGASTGTSSRRGPVDSSTTSPSIARADMRASVSPRPDALMGPGVELLAPVPAVRRSARASLASMPVPRSTTRTSMPSDASRRSARRRPVVRRRRTPARSRRAPRGSGGRRRG